MTDRHREALSLDEVADKIRLAPEYRQEILASHPEIMEGLEFLETKGRWVVDHAPQAFELREELATLWRRGIHMGEMWCDAVGHIFTFDINFAENATHDVALWGEIRQLLWAMEDIARGLPTLAVDRGAQLRLRSRAGAENFRRGAGLYADNEANLYPETFSGPGYPSIRWGSGARNENGIPWKGRPGTYYLSQIGRQADAPAALDQIATSSVLMLRRAIGSFLDFMGSIVALGRTTLNFFGTTITILSSIFDLRDDWRRGIWRGIRSLTSGVVYPILDTWATYSLAELNYRRTRGVHQSTMALLVQATDDARARRHPALAGGRWPDPRDDEQFPDPLHEGYSGPLAVPPLHREERGTFHSLEPAALR